MGANVSSALALSILVVDDEPNIRKTLKIALEADGHHVLTVSNPKDALSEANARYFDLALVDLRLGSESGIDLIGNLLAICPWIKCIVVTAYASIDTAVEAMRRGAFDYLPKPFTNDQVSVLVNKVSEVRTLEQKVASLQERLRESVPEAVVESRSPLMQRVLAMARQVADSEATILIRGESGTGKTILAHAIHSWSGRSSKPFGNISCPSLSAELLESELFGHAKGSFTGALRDYPGRIAACDGGTLFLDEIGDLPLSIQAKLLRVLQEKAYERLGDLETRKANVRVLAATNIDLDSAVKAGRFREDLFYRLDVVEIVIPALRERREDIVPLAEVLLAFFARQNHRRVLGFTEEASEALENYEWPGNVRELRNAIERAVLLCSDDRVGIHHFPLKLKPLERVPGPGGLVTMEELERTHIRRVLASSRSIEEACRILGMDSVTFWRKRKK
ncbi:MAG TPA: sigma-54-dependent Fis family transcriptional regulator, partial [Deltaproteobacteria bacterium]|nr:sigma-54-dependent Fis family transcriptional regulator [Deltaproteobacteria bacterium]